MAATGLEVFDKTLQITNIWLDDIMAELGSDRQVAWHVLGAVLRKLRDRLPVDLSAHLGAQLPLLVRGLYYDQLHPARQPERYRTLDEFLAHVEEGLQGVRSVNTRGAAEAVIRTLARRADPGQTAKIIDALPEEMRSFCLDAMEAGGPPSAKGNSGESGS